MWGSNFFKIQNNSQGNHQPTFPNFEFTSAELYPRRRHTQFYYQASIPEEFQSRSFEHPSNLNVSDPLCNEEDDKKEKILPPKDSSMRIARDSYFS
ncbi:uncharacterized protein LOC129906174 [Episyrphus balteatus]|uniref:uncharacterized protein LOC129906174 n=1 Tax=Episyrphus balteatus TaxID=286459 RepID=UPI002484F571|nr:uncharacterized protein LOC129906174 [Episyrphus balteatus]